MQGFTGFPAGEIPEVALPHYFFSDLLPLIDNLAELKVTLHCLWLLGLKPGTLRYVQKRELLADERLRAGFSNPLEIDEGLERAVARNSLLHLVVERYGERADWYVLNDELGRDLLARVRSGRLPEFDEPLPENTGLRAVRPNIFVLYEQNIGLLQPLIADELRDAEQRYPPDWIEDAFLIAVEQNKRAWRYIRAILERWATEGRDASPGPRASRTPVDKKGSKRADPFAW